MAWVGWARAFSLFMHSVAIGWSTRAAFAAFYSVLCSPPSSN